MEKLFAQDKDESYLIESNQEYQAELAKATKRQQQIIDNKRRARIAIIRERNDKAKQYNSRYLQLKGSVDRILRETYGSIPQEGLYLCDYVTQQSWHPNSGIIIEERRTASTSSGSSPSCSSASTPRFVVASSPRKIDQTNPSPPIKPATPSFARGVTLPPAATIPTYQPIATTPTKFHIPSSPRKIT